MKVDLEPGSLLRQKGHFKKAPNQSDTSIIQNEPITFNTLDQYNKLSIYIVGFIVTLDKIVLILCSYGIEQELDQFQWCKIFYIISTRLFFQSLNL